MSNEEASDVIDRMEAIAPNLNPVHLADFDNFVCCSEVFKEPKPKPCEVSSRAIRPQCVCMCKTRLYPKCQKCNIVNERDILYRPIRFRCKNPRKVLEKKNLSTLGAPIGLSKSSFSMRFLEAKSSGTEISLQGFATLLIAFAEYFITPEIEWDEQVLNRILFEGQRLYTDSKQSIPEGETLKESAIKKTFMLCNNSFDILVNEPFLIGQVVGDGQSVPNLYWGLAKFFKKFQFCLLQIGRWYLLLWKNFEVFFVFDCFGRRSEDFRKDQKMGIAMLICLRNYDNVSHLLLNLSGIKPDQIYTIRRLQIKSVVPCGGQPTPEIVDRSIEFEVINEDYALLRGSIHLGSDCFKEIRYKHSLAVAFCALINAKIDATPTWNSAVLDKVIKLGAEFFMQWTQCDISLELGIQDIPKRFVFGQFLVEIAVEAIAECGLWKCTPNYRHSEITLALRRAFDHGSNLIVQIQGRSYALWKKGTFYYVLDPYSHQCSLGNKKIIAASLRMCATIERLSCVFTQSLLELFEESKFVIHLMRILYLEELDKIDENHRRAQVPCTCIATPQTDWSHEVDSINDSVLGVDGYECISEELPLEGPDSADLDSPGLSQTRLENYTDLRKNFVDDSEEETDEEEDEEDVDILSEPDNDKPPSEEDDDEAAGAKDKQSKTKPKQKKEKGKAAGEASKDTDSSKRGHNQAHKESDDDKKKENKNKKKEADNEKKKRKEEEDARKKAEKERKEKERSDEKLAKAKAKKEQTEKERDEREKAEKEKAEKKKIESEKAEREKAEREKAERKKAEREKAEKEKAEREKAEREKAEREKAEREKAKREKAEREKAEKETAEREKTERERTEREKAEKEKTEKEKAEREKAEREKSEREKAERNNIDEEKTERDRTEEEKDDKMETDKENSAINEISEHKDLSDENNPNRDENSKDTGTRRQGHRRHKEQDGEDTTIPAGCKPNSYPGFTEDPRDLAVVGSESGNYSSLCILLRSAFRCTDRALTMTPWGNYVAFYSNRAFFIFDGCTCNLRSIRHMDLSVGTAGLLCFCDLHSLLQYIEDGRQAPKLTTLTKRSQVDQICCEYC